MVKFKNSERLYPSGLLNFTSKGNTEPLKIDSLKDRLNDCSEVIDSPISKFP